MAGAMIYVHEVHDILGGKMEEFSDAVRREWRRSSRKETARASSGSGS